MKARWLVAAVLFTGLSLALVWVVSAQGSTTSSVLASSLLLPLNQPGLTFQYERSLGVTETAYVPDASHINQPEGLWTDADNHLWVAERGGARVLQYIANGTLSTSIALGVLSTPADVATDSEGNVWIVDAQSSRVIQYDATGAVRRQLGITLQPGADNEHLNSPGGIAINASSGDIYISDTGNHRIQVFRRSGVYSATIGSSGISGTSNAQFNRPAHIALYNGYLYVADSGNHRVQIVRCDGVFSATLGISGAVGADNAHLNTPLGVAVSTQGIYVADSGNHRIQIFGGTTRTWQSTLGSGNPGSGNYTFNAPSDVTIDTNGNLYVSDSNNHRVQKYNSARVYQRTFGTTGIPYAPADLRHYNQPWGVATGAMGNLAIVEGAGHRVVVLGPDEQARFTIGESGRPGTDNAHLNQPRGGAFDAQSRLYIADAGNARVQIFDGAGTYLATLGSVSSPGPYRFVSPYDVAVDALGNIYVLDRTRQCVFKFDSNRIWMATLGVADEAGSDLHHLRDPQGIGVDSLCNVYIADSGNQRVLKYGADGSWQLTLGSTGVSGQAFHQFWEPSDVAIDAAGNIYVADSRNYRAQVFSADGDYRATLGGSFGAQIGQYRFVNRLAIGHDGMIYVVDRDNQNVQAFRPGTPGWSQINLNGWGDVDNQAVSTVNGFNAMLYAGTANERGGQVWRYNGTWEAVAPDGFGDAANHIISVLVEHNHNLYAATRNEQTGAEIWCSNTGNAHSWQAVVQDGLGDSHNIDVQALASFGEFLYAGTTRADGSSCAQIWRSRSGETGSWNHLTDIPADPANCAVLTLAVFDDNLYASTRNTAHGAEIWRSGEGSAWVQSLTGGFDDPNNCEVTCLREFQGHLYAGTRNEQSGAEIWRSRDGWSWSEVDTGALHSASNVRIATLLVFDDILYAVVDNATTGIEVWYSATGESGQWNSSICTGFGAGAAMRAGAGNSVAVAFDHNLYVGTATQGNNAAQIWARDASISGLQAENSSPTALGYTTVFTANVSLGSNVAYHWAASDDWSDNGRIVTHSFAHPGHYTVQVTASNSLGSLTATTYVTIQETIAELQAHCDPSTALHNPTWFTATVTHGTDPSFYWEFGDGHTDTRNPTEHTYEAVGIYAPTVTVTNSVSSPITQSCRVIVQAPIEGLVAVNNSPTCLGLPTQFMAEVAAGTDPTFEWNFGDTRADTGKIATNVYTHTGTFPASVTARNLVSRATVATVVTIEEAISGLSTSSDSLTRLGDPTHFTASVQHGNNVNFDWYFGDGERGGGMYAMHEYASPDTYYPYVVARNACNVATSTPTIVVVQEDIAGLELANTSPTMLGTETKFVATTVHGSDMAYTWEWGDGQQSQDVDVNARVITVTHSYTQADTYAVVVTAANRLRPAGDRVFATVKVEETIGNLQLSAISPAPAGVARIFTATVEPGSHVVCTWDTGIGPPKVSDEYRTDHVFTTTQTYAQPGNYMVTVRCENAFGVVTATQSLVVLQPITHVTFTTSSPTRWGQATHFTATATPNLPAVYTWDFGDGSNLWVSSVCTARHTYTRAGTYPVTVLVKNSVTEITEQAIVKVEELLAGLALSVHDPAAAGRLTTLSAPITAGTHETYDWNFDDGQTMPNGPSVVSHIYAIGSYTPTVTAKNDFSRLSASAHLHALQPINTVALTSSSPTEKGRRTVFTATITPSQPANYTWLFGDGSAPVVTNVGTISHEYRAIDDYTASVVARDEVSEASDTTVTAVDERLTDLTLLVCGPIARDALAVLTATSKSGSRLVYDWDFGDNSALVSTRSLTVAHAYSVTRDFTPTVTASNALGYLRASSRLTVMEPLHQVRVTNNSPKASGEPVAFTVTVEPDLPASFAWDFGDGCQTITDGKVVTHTYYPSCQARDSIPYVASVVASNKVSVLLPVTTPVSIMITLPCEYHIYLPSVFKPSTPFSITWEERLRRTLAKHL